MVINPQLFNSRITNGVLIVAIAALTVYSFTSYKSAESQHAFLEQEKELIANELQEMVSQYETVATENEDLASQLVKAESTAKNALQSISLLEGDIAVYLKYKKQLAGLRAQNSIIFRSIDSLENLNRELEREKLDAQQSLNEEIAANHVLRTENDELTTKLEIGSKFYADHLEVKAFTVNKGSRVETKKATNAETIEVCFTVSENILTDSGEKELFIQILNPKNNVFADKGAATFGEASLIYSAKKLIYYNNEAQDLCINVNADRDDKPLDKGIYFVSVFHNERKLASTKVVLE